PDDHRHRVVDVAALHLDLDVNRLGPVVPPFGRPHHFGHFATSPSKKIKTSDAERVRVSREPIRLLLSAAGLMIAKTSPRRARTVCAIGFAGLSWPGPARPGGGA